MITSFDPIIKSIAENLFFLAALAVVSFFSLFSIFILFNPRLLRMRRYQNNNHIETENGQDGQAESRDLPGSENTQECHPSHPGDHHSLQSGCF